MRILIGIPCNRDHNPAFEESLRCLVRYVDKNGVNGKPVTLDVLPKVQASNLPSARQDLLTQAIVGGYTHLLFVDNDESFPEHSLDYLLSHDLPVVGVNFVRKNPDLCQYTALDCQGQMLISKGKTGITQVSKVGCGMMLIKLEALRGIPAPHFAMEWVQLRHRYRGEDFTFCTVVSKHGVQVFVDHDLSNQVGHIGDFCYRIDTYGTVEEVQTQAVANYKASQQRV